MHDFLGTAENYENLRADHKWGELKGMWAIQKQRANLWQCGKLWGKWFLIRAILLLKWGYSNLKLSSIS